MENNNKWFETKSFAYGELIMSILIGGIFSYLKPAIGIPVLVIMFCIGCLLMWKAYSKQSITAAIIVVFFSVLSFSVLHSLFGENKILNFATPEALIDSVLKNKDIRICDLARESSTVKNRTFENCRIYGPAIIYITNSIISQNGLIADDPNAHFIETSNKSISGVINLDNCVIKNCTFENNISFIGQTETIKKVKEGFKKE